MADHPSPGPLQEKLPRHTEIKTYLLDRMRSGALKPDDKTESENELARRFSVSRLTVQRAIRELVAEGRLTRVQGSGTFVAPSRRGSRCSRCATLPIRCASKEAIREPRC
jgi:GntR family histidine utilization transcriptional repressor